MDVGLLGEIHFTWDFLLALLSIILIDLILAGDNAVVIAMAVRSLPRKKRQRGILFGAGAAVLLRVILTFFASQLLQVRFIKFIGGAVILWIAVKLFMEGAPGDEAHTEAKTLWQAIWVIVVADITMSTDNVLAVAGASQGNLFLLLFGLGLSIPFVVFTSNLLSLLMDKFPLILYLGAAVLGRVGGEMLITDPFIQGLLHPGKGWEVGIQIFCTLGVIGAGKLGILWRRSREKKELEGQEQGGAAASSKEG